MRVLKLLQHLQLIVDHALIATNVLLENDLDRNLGTIMGLSLTDDTVCTRAERTSELVQGPEERICLSAWSSGSGEGGNRTFSRSSQVAQRAC